MLDIISANPYRVLGVYSNSPKKELVANLSKINAFLKVGKPVSFPTDMLSLLPGIERTSEMVANANSKLALPADQFQCAQFWFVKVTKFDDIALNNLIAGDIDKAMSIWEKREDASSLQNWIVCNLILGNVSDAISCAEILYSSCKNDFVKAILGDNPPVEVKEVEYDFLDKLCEELGVNEILSHVSDRDWKKHISGQAVKPLVDGLLNAVSVAKQSKGNGTEARYNAGTKLMNDTKAPLKQLKSLMNETDLQYQMVADKVGLEILQCGIDYYNDTKTYDAPKKAIVLMRYALSIVVGQMARERCKENVNIVQKAVDNMLPEIVREEAETIEQELQKFYKLPELICYAVTMLNNVKPHLQSIKVKLGAADSSYLKLSTRVVKDAIYNVVQEVNSIQKNEPSNYFGTKFTVQNAWNAMRIMDSFDKEEAFKSKYNENRSILRGICNIYDVNTETEEERKARIKREEEKKKEWEEKEKKRKEEQRKAQTGIWIFFIVFEIIVLILCLTVSWWFILLGIYGPGIIFSIFSK